MPPWPAARGTGAPGFMPAVYQGTQLDGGAQPIANLQTPASVGPARQQGKLDYLGQLNRRHLLSRLDQSELDARIKSYELAFRMQAEAPEAVDLARETAATQPSTAWTIRRRIASGGSACWPGGWSSAACGSCRSTAAPAASGTLTAASKQTTLRPAARWIGRSRDF